jgi:uncharacterized protein
VSNEPLTIDVDGARVSGLWRAPENPIAAMTFAHGAGAGMTHAFMEAAAAGLAERGVATLRFNFPYWERGSKRTDAPAVAHAAVRAAAAAAAARVPAPPLFAGGKSFGARMTSQAQAESPLVGVRGLVFFGFPLHPAGAPGTVRADHLDQVSAPMLFLQGTRDALAELSLLRAVAAKLGPRATLALSEDADHGFHVRAKSGRTDEQAFAELLDAAVAWMKAQAAEDVLSKC